MFERVPWLRGDYLNYRGYFTLVFVVSAGLQVFCSFTFICVVKLILLRQRPKAIDVRDQYELFLNDNSSNQVVEEIKDEEFTREQEFKLLERGKSKRKHSNDSDSGSDDDDGNDKVSKGSKNGKSKIYKTPYKLDKIYQCIIIAQSFIMFVVVSLLSFGGGGNPSLYCSLAVAFWLVIGLSLYFILDKHYNIQFYGVLTSKCVFLMYFWLFILLLQFSAWSLINPLFGTLICFVPAQMYVFYCYHQVRTKDTLKLLRDRKRRVFCIKNTAISLAISITFV